MVSWANAAHQSTLPASYLSTVSYSTLIVRVLSVYLMHQAEFKVQICSTWTKICQYCSRLQTSSLMPTVKYSALGFHLKNLKTNNQAGYYFYRIQLSYLIWHGVNCVIALASMTKLWMFKWMHEGLSYIYWDNYELWNDTFSIPKDKKH